MAFEYGARLNKGDYFSTTVDVENQTAETKGTIDGEPVDFGGGSSDFSTATVTVISNAGVTVQTSYVANNVEDVEGGCASMPSINTEFIEGPLTIILYKGHAWFAVSEGVLSADGDATIIDDIFADITGDCTITIS